MLKIVLTGGPCAGKSIMLSSLVSTLEDRGYKVFAVPESASILILNGIYPSKNISMKDFQNFVIDMQLNHEELANNAAKYFDDEKVIIFYDRGLMDNAAYIKKDPDLKQMFEKRGLTLSDVYNRYDAVLHLVTTADGAEQYYQWNDPTKDDVGNNAARSESPAEARDKDKKTLEAWIGHPHLRVFDNSTDFETKTKRVVDEVFALLGEPAPSEIERKFLIKKPTLDIIERLGCVSKAEIIQTYLKNKEHTTERRIRQRGSKDDGFSFYYTEKTDVSPGIRIEKEYKIDQDRYLELMTEADNKLHQIVKTRYCFIYEKQYFEMDLYAFSDEYAILEIELKQIDDEVMFPPLDIVAEVTNDSAFRNSSLAQNLSFDTEKIADYQVSFSNKQDDWCYETGKEETNILGSGSNRYNIVTTKCEDEAFKLFKDSSRNYLHRYKRENGKIITQWYNYYLNQWVE